MVFNLSLDTVPVWNKAVFIPMDARVCRAMLERSRCVLDVILLPLLLLDVLGSQCGKTFITLV